MSLGPSSLLTHTQTHKLKSPWGVRQSHKGQNEMAMSCVKESSSAEFHSDYNSHTCAHTHIHTLTHAHAFNPTA